MERFYGLRCANDAADWLASDEAPSPLDPEQRAWLRHWVRGPRSGPEVISGLRLRFLQSYRATYEGDPGWSRTGEGPLTEAGVPDEFNPEALSDREIVAAWRGLAVVLGHIEAETRWGPDATKDLERTLRVARSRAGRFELQACEVLHALLTRELDMEEQTRTLLLDVLRRDE